MYIQSRLVLYKTNWNRNRSFNIRTTFKLLTKLFIYTTELYIVLIGSSFDVVHKLKLYLLYRLKALLAFIKTLKKSFLERNLYIENVCASTIIIQFKFKSIIIMIIMWVKNLNWP